MNIIDSIVEVFSPGAALRRRTARSLLAYYEAATPSRTRKFYTDRASPDRITQVSAEALRIQARRLDANHDIARGILHTLVANTVGPHGIGIEPQPRRADGGIHEDYAKALREAWRDWCRRPEVTHRHSWAKAQRMMARTWLRDGECFAQTLIGNIASLDHGTRVPLSIEMIEPDLVPYHYTDETQGIRQGIQRNAWGRPRGYYAYKAHPGEQLGATRDTDLKRIPAERMLHIAALDRIGQLRGVSEFASVITRLEDIKDYEESERVAAKIAAMLTAYVKKGAPDLYTPEGAPRDENGNILPRELNLQPGMILDNLAIGEEVGLIDAKRPNPNVMSFRQGQLRATAAGVRASYSTISRDYGGTYSSQRQELVEQWTNYATLTDEFVGMCVRPVWELFVMAAHLSGVVVIPREVVTHTADDALYVAQSMPWIDPLREVEAWKAMTRAGFASEVEVMRRRGVNPRDVLEQLAAHRKAAAAAGLVFDSDAAKDGGAAKPADTGKQKPDDGAAQQDDADDDGADSNDAARQ